MASILKVNKIQNSSATDAITIAGDGSFGGTFNGTVGSSTNFPSGHVIQDIILYTEPMDDTGHISTGSDTYVDSGIAGSFTTIKSSSDSYLSFEFNAGMSTVSGGDSQWGTTAMTLRTADTTTYATGDDMLSAASPTGAYRNRLSGHAGYVCQFFRMIFHVSTGGNSYTPSNLTSYTAGQTLYARLYIAEPSGGTYYLVHVDSHYIFKVQEIMR